MALAAVPGVLIKMAVIAAAKVAEQWIAVVMEMACAGSKVRVKGSKNVAPMGVQSWQSTDDNPT